MTVQPDDPNFGNKGIENIGNDLLSRLSQPNKVEEPNPFDLDEETYSGEYSSQFAGNEGSEPEETETPFDPNDPGVSEQRRLLSLQIAATLNPNNVEALMHSAKVVEKWLKSGGDETAPGAPEAVSEAQASPGTDPGEGLTGPEGV